MRKHRQRKQRSDEINITTDSSRIYQHSYPSWECVRRRKDRMDDCQKRLNAATRPQCDISEEEVVLPVTKRVRREKEEEEEEEETHHHNRLRPQNTLSRLKKSPLFSARILLLML
jgi:hypothetical protein